MRGRCCQFLHTRPRIAFVGRKFFKRGEKEGRTMLESLLSFPLVFVFFVFRFPSSSRSCFDVYWCFLTDVSGVSYCYCCSSPSPSFLLFFCPSLLALSSTMTIVCIFSSLPPCCCCKIFVIHVQRLSRKEGIFLKWW